MNHVVLATVEGNQPRLRPMTLMRYEDHFYFATSSDTDKITQLTENPNVEALLQWKQATNNGYIRVQGKAHRVQDKTLISELYTRYDFFSKLWENSQDTNLTIYTIKPQYYDYMKPGKWASRRVEIK